MHFATSRLAVENHPRFYAPGGSLRDLATLYTERSPNARSYLAGLGCACQATRLGPRGASAALDGARYYGLGDAAQDAIDWANTTIAVVRGIAAQAVSYGGPGFTPTDTYYAQFLALSQQLDPYVNQYVQYKDALPPDVASQVFDALNGANKKIQSVMNGSDESSWWRTFLDTLNTFPTFAKQVAAGTAHDVASGAAEAGKSLVFGAGLGTIALAALAALYFFGRGR